MSAILAFSCAFVKAFGYLPGRRAAALDPAVALSIA